MKLTKEHLFKDKKYVLENVDKKAAARLIFNRFEYYLSESSVNEIDLDRLMIDIDDNKEFLSIIYKGCWFITDI